ncbi:chemotaxis protein CheB [Alienimonas sp. DA493]|uniref:chemotaxis protein CheB n=1 Tax=Alienimonas sp. DA493 TaxID=3373605 RepID=UPI003754A871
MSGHDVIAVGGSAGAMEAVRRLLADLPPDLRASVFVVLHASMEIPDGLPDILNRHCPLQVERARDGAAVEHGRVYVFRPDYHLVVRRGEVRVTRGPRENRSRPAIDVLFRSAAAAYGSRVVGVLLSGYLDDGSAGLRALKRCGGHAVVQDPEDALVADMPRNAIERVAVDDVLPLAEIPRRLAELASASPGPSPPPPADVVQEAEIAERASSEIPKEEALGRLAPLSCPECGGPLWELDDGDVRRYRCHVGHGMTARSLLCEQDDAFEEALWVALRTLEERTNLLRTLAGDAATAGGRGERELFETRATESDEQASLLRRLLRTGSTTRDA